MLNRADYREPECAKSMDAECGGARVRAHTRHLSEQQPCLLDLGQLGKVLHRPSHARGRAAHIATVQRAGSSFGHVGPLRLGRGGALDVRVPRVEGHFARVLKLHLGPDLGRRRAHQALEPPEEHRQAAVCKCECVARRSEFCTELVRRVFLGNGNRAALLPVFDRFGKRVAMRSRCSAGLFLQLLHMLEQRARLRGGI